MKYYVGSVAITDHESRREYERICVIAARTETAAQQLVNEWAQHWDDDGEPDGAGWEFSAGDRGYLVEPGTVRPITAAAFDAMRHHVVSFVQAGQPETLADEPADERVKTLARRIGEQLKKHDAKVAHGKLLHAVAASLGETDWQVLLHKRPAASGTDSQEQVRAIKAQFNAAIDFAIGQGLEAATFLGAWREGDTSEWPEFESVVPDAGLTAAPQQTVVPGTGALWEVPLQVHTTASARVRVRALNKHAALATARQLAAEGNVAMSLDADLYRGAVDYALADGAEVVCLDPAGASEAPMETANGVQAGDFRIELCSLEADDELLWADFEVFGAEGEEHIASAMSCMASDATKEERMAFCRRVAELFARVVKRADALDARSLEHVFIDAVQGEQSEAAFEALERKLTQLAAQHARHRGA